MRDYLINEETLKLLIDSLGSSKAVNAGHSFNLHRCLATLVNLKPVEKDTEEKA